MLDGDDFAHLFLLLLRIHYYYYSVDLILWKKQDAVKKYDEKKNRTNKQKLLYYSSLQIKAEKKDCLKCQTPPTTNTYFWRANFFDEPRIKTIFQHVSFLQI